MTIAVTGATGRLGGRVARRLAAAGVPPRLLVRDAARAPRLPGTTVVAASYADAEAAERALAGVDVLFMVSASESRERVAHHTTFIHAAVAAGVQHVVYTSFVGAAPEATFTLARDHWATEEHIRASGLAHTLLRNNLYADFLPLMVERDGVLRGPAGDGRVAAVAQDDIADAVAAVLLAPAAHASRTYDLTGPQGLSLTEVAEVLSTMTGQAVTYHAQTVAEAYESRATYGAPEWQVDAWVSTYTAIAAGEMAAVSDAVPDLTGHPATAFAELLARSG